MKRLLLLLSFIIATVMNVSAQGEWFMDTPPVAGSWTNTSVPGNWIENLKAGDYIKIVAQIDPNNPWGGRLVVGYNDAGGFQQLTEDYASTTLRDNGVHEITFSVDPNLQTLKENGIVIQHSNIKFTSISVVSPSAAKTPLVPTCQYGNSWVLELGKDYVDWVLPNYNVTADGADVSNGDYTLTYEVLENAPLTINGKLVTVNSEDSRLANLDVYSGTGKITSYDAKIRVTATPAGVNAANFEAGSVILNVHVLPEPKMTSKSITPNVARIGERINVSFSRNTGFPNIEYYWTLSNGGNNYLHDAFPKSVTGTEATSDYSMTLAGKAVTPNPVEVYVQLRDAKTDDDLKYATLYTGFYGNDGITIKPVAEPTITEKENGSLEITYESDYQGVYGDVDAFLEYQIGDGTVQQTGFGNNSSVFTLNDVPANTFVYVNSVIRYYATQADKDANNYTYVASSKVTFVTRSIAELPNVEMIMQPRWKEGIAKQYIPIGSIDKIVESTNEQGAKVYTHTTLSSEWPNSVTNGMGAIKNNTVGYILGDNTYAFNAQKGIRISDAGKVKWGYLSNGVKVPQSGAFFMNVAGTMDVTVYVIKEGNQEWSNRRQLEAWYFNDQCGNEPKKLYTWDIDGSIRGERADGDPQNDVTGSELKLHVRLPQLGKDGTATIFFTYNGSFGSEASDEANAMWIRGFLIKRPDLTMSIGRTDNLYPGNSLTALCVKEPNTPYVWSFEPNEKNDKDEYVHDDHTDAVGFRPAVDTDEKKTNVYDGRTYLCGKKCDHLLVYCDNADVPGAVAASERPEFDGRLSRDGNAHLELVRPTVMAANNGNADQFNPILSNGIKVNMTGSGWFKAKVSAPNCDVKMKFLASTNGGMSKIRVLKEFFVPKTSEIEWNEYTAYLKAQATYDQTYDVGVTDKDPEEQYMSIYVVFEAADGVSLNSDGSCDAQGNFPQLNINQLSWLNEIPMDYVFQREENPVLLKTLQAVKRNDVGSGWQNHKADRVLTDNDKDKIVLYWQAGSSIKEKLDGAEVTSTFDINNQRTVENGRKSYAGQPSRGTGNDGEYLWDMAAVPVVASHTELAQRFEDGYVYNDDTKYDLNKKDTEKEFGLPISGSFYRLFPQKNGHIIAYIVPTVANQKVYVLDETGAPIDYFGNNDTYVNLSQYKKAHGGVKVYDGGDLDEDTKVYTASTSDFGTIRLDILAFAGKEYFICGDAPISLAALHWYQTRGEITKPETAGVLNNNGTDNWMIITGAKSAQNEGTYDGTMYTDVTLNRSFEANKWASLVLPFSMNELKFKEVFGDDAICIHFDNIDLTTNTVNLVHHYYNMIVAGRPVFVRPSKSFTTADIMDVTLQAGEVISTFTNEGKIKFTGNIDNGTIPENSLFMSGNAIKHTTVKKENVGAMRVWIEGGSVLEDIANKAAPVARLLNYDGTLLDGDIATGIESALAEAGMDAAVISASTVIYNLQGNKVATGAEMQNLPAGVYVVKGKKFIVK